MTSKFIRTSQHYINNTNISKFNKYQQFLSECEKTLIYYLNYIWNNKIVYTIKNNQYILDIQNNIFDCPRWLSTKNIPIQTNLSARVLKCIMTQALGIIRSAIDKRKQQQFICNKLIQENKSAENLKHKLSKILTFPKVKNFAFELNSIVTNFKESNKYFNGFIQLSSIGKSFGKIRIPINFHRQSNKWKKRGYLLSSFLFFKDKICFRWELDKNSKQSGSVIGADQGINSTLTLSNGSATKQNKHGYDLNKINKILSRKKKGSKAFKKSQEHRLNYVNWSLNQLDFSSIKQINLEKINTHYKTKKSRFLSHFAHSLIQDKLERLAEEEGFSIKLNNSVYRSQRCSNCGLVCKSNREDKEYNCKCGLSIDADLNAAKNHEQELYELPYGLQRLKLNIKGFYWNDKGIFDLIGQAITVPDVKKSK